MTYDVLEKITKKELIAGMRRHVCLPRNISDEEFLRQVKIARLFEEQEALLEKDDEINRELSAATNNPYEFMRLMVEGDKINEEIDRIDKQINQLMRATDKKS